MDILNTIGCLDIGYGTCDMVSIKDNDFAKTINNREDMDSFLYDYLLKQGKSFKSINSVLKDFKDVKENGGVFTIGSNNDVSGKSSFMPLHDKEYKPFIYRKD